MGWGFWPPKVPREETVSAFAAAFATIGYSPSDDGAVEIGFEKIALYVDRLGAPTHAARQLSDGRWTSKLGKDIDIAHTGLNDFPPHCSYGIVVAYFKRPVR
jgi:hypothetical protein